MSINTANLVTTTNGQTALADVHNINARLHTDHREISVKLLFPYMVISTKSTSDIDTITASTDEEIRAEASWTHVDVCQVQSYSVENDARRDFAIGGLFNVEQNIEGAKTFILFCKTHIVDARSASKKRADGNREAADILQSEYGYVTVQLPFAYTQILDSAGEVPENGITIGAAKYGRSRHRFYFNYIIDNNTGIADNITVDDNVYPYSDGYLSKTAFELGLKRYEAAVAQYQAEYEKYANGHKLYYKNMEEAIKWAQPGHKFYIKNLETDAANFDDVDLQSAIANWIAWPTDDPIGNDTYKNYTAANYGMPVAGDDADRYKYERAVIFEVRDVRPVEFEVTRNNEKVTETRYLPIRFKFMMFIRSAVPWTGAYYSANGCYTALYHAMRVWVNIGDIYGGFEVNLLTDESAFLPVCPTIGKIKVVDGYILQLGLLTNDADITPNPVTQDGGYVFDAGPRFRFIEAGFNGEGGVYYAANQVVASFNCTRYTSGSNPSGKLFPYVFSNFAGGYSYSTSESPGGPGVQGEVSIYEIPLKFDALAMYSETLKPTMKKEGLVNALLVNTNAILNDTVVSRTGFEYGNNYIYKDKDFIEKSYYTEGITIGNVGESSNYRRLVGEYRLHNGRVFVIDEVIGSASMFIRSTSLIEVHAYINNRYYTKSSTYGATFGSVVGGANNVEDISFVEVVEVYVGSNETLGVIWNVHYKDHNLNKWEVAQVDDYAPLGAVPRYVAIEDVDGTTNIIKETVG